MKVVIRIAVDPVQADLADNPAARRLFWKSYDEAGDRIERLIREYLLALKADKTSEALEIEEEVAV